MMIHSYISRHIAPSVNYTYQCMHWVTDMFVAKCGNSSCMLARFTVSRTILFIVMAYLFLETVLHSSHLPAIRCSWGPLLVKWPNASRPMCASVVLQRKKTHHSVQRPTICCTVQFCKQQKTWISDTLLLFSTGGQFLEKRCVAVHVYGQLRTSHTLHDEYYIWACAQTWVLTVQLWEAASSEVQLRNTLRWL